MVTSPDGRDVSRLPGNAADIEGTRVAEPPHYLSVGADSSPVSVPTTSLHEHSAPHNIRTYNQSTRAPDASLVLGVWSVSWARVQVVVWLHVVVRLPERDEGGGFSVSFVSFAKFRKVSGRAAAGRPSGGVGPATVSARQYLWREPANAL